jgi:hypothetical protein
MIQTLNQTVVEEYAKKYANISTASFFAVHSQITGKQILSFSDVQQINLFVLSRLFSSWQQETGRLQSPYFDYTVPEVQEALQQFMNTVSRYISVRREHFTPLVAQATESTLKLLLTPREFFRSFLLEIATPALTVNRLRENTRYIQIHKIVWKTLVEQVENRYTDTLSVNDAEQLLDSAFQIHQQNLDASDPYFVQLAKLAPLPDSWEKKQQPAQATISSTPPAEKLQVNLEEFVRAASQPTQPLFSPTSDKVPAADKPLILNEKFSRDQLTLNDRLKKESTDNLLHKQQKARIENIRGAITLNQKFIFINGLFRGDNAAFNLALNELEQCTSYEEAVQLLQTRYASQFVWNMENEEVKAFFEIVERKFY